jgi:ATP-dependent RNA helicase DDX19/DBP5
MHCDGLRVQLLVPGMEGEGDRLTAQVLVGTPGKIHQLYAMKRTLRLQQMKVVVFDEGDHLLAGGFRDSSTRLLREVRKFNKKVQVLLFSATFNDAVKDFALRQVPNANQIFLAKEDLSLDVIKQYKVKVPSREDKATVVKERIFELADLKSGQSIIFVKTRANAAKLHAEMESEGHKCTSIHGKMTHEDRDRVVNEFREGRTRVLIATDVLSRGFDVSSVTLVVNYDIPTTESGQPDYETYVHRVGRTGRLGKKGAAFNLVCNRGDEAQLASISKYYNHGIEEVPWDSDEAFLEALKKADLSNG